MPTSVARGNLRREPRRCRGGEARLRDPMAVEYSSLSSSMELQHFLEAAPDAIVVADREGRIVLANQATERMFAYAHEDLIGRPVECLLPRRQLGRRCDGTALGVDISLGQLDTGAGPLVIRIIREVAPRPMVLPAHVHEREAEELKLLIEGVKDAAIVMLDSAGRVATWNEGATRITGYTADEVLGRHFSTFSSPEQRREGQADAPLQTALREGRAEYEDWRVRKDGSRFWAHITVTALRDETGRLRGFGKVTRDLSERRRAEQQRERLISELRDAVRARDEFLQVASHELKTPLTPLQLQLDTLGRLLEKAGIRSERLHEKLETATRQTLRLTRLVESILDVSRITGGRLALHLERLDLVELVREVAARFREDARRAGSELVVRAPDSLHGSWDRQRVDQILSNLMTNAIKYGPGKPIEIEVAGACHEETVRVSVTDRGIGIHNDEIGRIFGRFERAVSIRHFGGLGLGLFIASQFAHAHGGTLLGQSEPGAGSTFSVVLPVETIAQPSPAWEYQEEGG
jgi:PAS domain S-box-containing protein